MGVLLTEPLPAGEVFGPIPSNLGLTDPTLLIGHMTSDNRPDVHTVKVSIHDLHAASRACEWVPYVAAARDEREQNLEACLLEGELHYRVLRTLSAGAELRVWYHPQLAARLDIPEINSNYVKEGGVYQCPRCMDVFRYPNSLRAHMRFKCKLRRSTAGSDAKSQFSVGQQKLSSGTKYFPKKMSLNDVSALSFHPYAGLMRDSSGTLLSPTTSSSSLSPNHADTSPRRTPEKRSLDDSDDVTPQAKRLSSEFTSRDSSPECIPRQRSPSGRQYKLDQNQNLNETKEEEEVGSAFRKVEKQRSEVNRSLSNTALTPPETHGQVIAYNADALNRNITSGLPPPSLFPRYPMMGVFPHTLVSSTNYNENIPLNLADIYRNNIKMKEIPRLSDKITDIRRMENRVSLPFISNQPSLPVQHFKSPNPMVDKLLHTNISMMPTAVTQLSLLQNWCAKCNQTFRMTSDLVYHMRSHHQSRKDEVKVKREEKLKCTICGETFRERHHLTRHMTSHT